MKAIKWMFIFLASIFIVLLAYIYYLGMFDKVVFEERSVGPFELVYKNHYGAYSGIGKVMDEVHSSLEAIGVKTFKGFAVYYDDPKVTPPPALRSIGGCVIEETDRHRIPDIKKLFAVSALPSSENIVAEFPYRNKLSVYLSIMKVYPELDAYRTQKGYSGAPIMEIYDIRAGKILYIMPIVK